MASLASVVRLSARQSAVWRPCTACTALAPLAPDATVCRECSSSATPTRRRPARAA